MPYFKKLLSYLKSPLWNLRNFKVSSKIKKTLNLFPKIHFWVTLGDNLSYLKLAPLSLSNVKFHVKQIFEFVTKNASRGYF